MTNHARRGLYGDRLQTLGCREVEIKTYLDADEDGSRKLNIDEMNQPWAEKEAEAEATAHRWPNGKSPDAQFFLECYVGVDGRPPSLTKQCQGVNRFGEAFMREQADIHDAKLGSNRPGRNPNATADDDKGAVAKGTKNPWHAGYKGTNAEAERIRIIKTLGTKVAAGMATAAGTDLAGRPLKGRAA